MKNFTQTLGGPIIETTAGDIVQEEAVIATYEGVIKRHYSEFQPNADVRAADGKRPEEIDASNDD